jgi:hypothetical protein
LHTLGTKVVAKYTEGIFSSDLGEGQYMDLKTPVWNGEVCGANQQPLWGKPGTALAWRNQKQAETDVSPKEKLISNSQTCPLSGRGW